MSQYQVHAVISVKLVGRPTRCVHLQYILALLMQTDPLRVVYASSFRRISRNPDSTGCWTELDQCRDTWVGSTGRVLGRHAKIVKQPLIKGASIFHPQKCVDVSIPNGR